MLVTRTKLFFFRSRAGDPELFPKAEQEINAFLMTIPDQKVLAIDFKYYTDTLEIRTSYAVACIMYEADIV